MIKSVNTVALIRPDTKAVAIGAQEIDLLGIPMAIGNSPKVVVTVVIRTGRMRAAQDSMMACRKGFPMRRRTFIKSISSSESLTARPANPIMARKLPMVKVVRVIYNPKTTPIRAIGTDEMIINGWT